MCRTTGGFDQHPVGRRRLIFDTRISKYLRSIPSDLFSHTTEPPGITELHSTRTVSTIAANPRRGFRLSSASSFFRHSRNNNNIPFFFFCSNISGGLLIYFYIILKGVEQVNHFSHYPIQHLSILTSPYPREDDHFFPYSFLHPPFSQQSTGSQQSIPKRREKVMDR